jgi:hypothetical protein
MRNSQRILSIWPSGSLSRRRLWTIYGFLETTASRYGRVVGAPGGRRPRWTLIIERHGARSARREGTSYFVASHDRYRYQWITLVYRGSNGNQRKKPFHD